MKNLTFLITILLIPFFAQSQIGLVEPTSNIYNQHDTLWIQYLSKLDNNISTSVSRNFILELENDTTLNIEYKLEYYQFLNVNYNQSIKYVLKVWGEDNSKILPIIQKYYIDAYYIDNKNGYRVNKDN